MTAAKQEVSSTATTFFGNPATRVMYSDGSGVIFLADGGVFQIPALRRVPIQVDVKTVRAFMGRGFA